VVVHNLDLMRLAVLPQEADSVLVVDPDAVFAPPVAGKGFEVIPRESPQVLESVGGV
jgi:hypothetical protein